MFTLAVMITLPLWFLNWRQRSPHSIIHVTQSWFSISCENFSYFSFQCLLLSILSAAEFFCLVRKFPLAITTAYIYTIRSRITANFVESAQNAACQAVNSPRGALNCMILVSVFNSLTLIISIVVINSIIGSTKVKAKLDIASRYPIFSVTVSVWEWFLNNGGDLVGW